MSDDIDAMRKALRSVVGYSTDAEKKYVDIAVKGYGQILDQYSGYSTKPKDNEVTTYFAQHGLAVLTQGYKDYFVQQASHSGELDKERDTLGAYNSGLSFAAVNIEQVYSIANELREQKNFARLDQMIEFIKQEAASYGMHQALVDASSPQHFGSTRKSMGHVGGKDAGQTLTANSEAPEKSADASGIARAVTIHGVHYLAVSGEQPHHGLSGGNIPKSRTTSIA